MSCVYILGPKTSFGQSEQNPAYWLQLLMIAKKVGAKCTWYDPVANVTKERYLRSNDSHIWGRFFMSFLINGVGFHILVHALPIQVAYQSTLTGVVIRAVGMMYLVDLDDTSGYVLTLVEEKKPEKGPDAPNKLADNSTPSWCTPEAEDRFQAPPLQKVDTSEVSDEAARIINEAMAKLADLSRGELPMVNKSMRHMAGNLLMMPASSKQLSTARIDYAGENEPFAPSRQSRNPIVSFRQSQNPIVTLQSPNPVVPVRQSQNPIQDDVVVKNGDDIEGGGEEKTANTVPENTFAE